jgi:AraC-like DNA-binding protein
LTGKESYIVNNKKYVLNPGEMLLVNEGSETVFFVEEKNVDPTKGIAFFLDEDLMQDVYSSISSGANNLEPIIKNTPLHFFNEINYRKENEDLNSFIKQSISKITIQRESLLLSDDFYSNFAEKLVLSHVDVLRKMHLTGKIRLATKREIYSRVTKARDYIDGNVCDTFDLEKLARISFLTKYNLIRYFKAITGYTPQQYYFVQKTDLAKKLLINDTVTNVAFLCGYSDIHSFSRQFKSVTGFSPTYFKQKTK